MYQMSVGSYNVNYLHDGHVNYLLTFRHASGQHPANRKSMETASIPEAYTYFMTARRRPNRNRFLKISQNGCSDGFFVSFRAIFLCCSSSHGDSSATVPGSQARRRGRRNACPVNSGRAKRGLCARTGSKCQTIKIGGSGALNDDSNKNKGSQYIRQISSSYPNKP